MIKISFFVALCLSPLKVGASVHIYNAVADMVLPPIELWAALAVAWYVHNAWNAHKTGVALPVQPGFVLSLAIFLGLGTASILFCGYIVLLMLMLPPIKTYIAVILTGKLALEPEAATLIRRTGHCYLLLFVITIALMLYLRLNRAPEELIIKWGADSPAVELFYDLYESEPGSLLAYRRILMEGDAFSAKLAAERIGALGDSKNDVPLLEWALQKHADDAVAVVAIEAALLRLRGVSADSESVEPVMRLDFSTVTEFLAWQTELKRLLTDKLMITDLLDQRNTIDLAPAVASQSESANFVRHSLSINTTADRRIEIVLSVPAAAKPDDKYPAVVVVHGHGSTKEAVYEYDNNYHGFASELAKAGYITIAADIGRHEIYAAEGTLVGERLWDLIRCVDYLESLPQVDSNKIGVAGLSLGGQMAMWLGAIDSRVKAVVSSGFLARMSHLDSVHCGCWEFEGLRELADFTHVYALIAPRALQLQIGRREPPWQFGVAQARELYDQLQIAWKITGRIDQSELLIHEHGHEVDVTGMIDFLDGKLGVDRHEASLLNKVFAALRENVAMLLSILLILMLALFLLV